MSDLVDAAYRLMTMWFCQDEEQIKQVESVNKYFRDRETEFETGMPVLPGWATVGNVAAAYGLTDADPFAVMAPQPDRE